MMGCALHGEVLRWTLFPLHKAGQCEARCRGKGFGEMGLVQMWAHDICGECGVDDEGDGVFDSQSHMAAATSSNNGLVSGDRKP